MFSIETINKLDKRWRLLTFMFVLIFIISATALCFYIQHIQIQQKAISLEKSVSNLRMQALKAQTDGALDKADSLYTQALAEAENSGSSMKVIEFLSRLVQVKIQNHKLGQTDVLVQKAIKLALTIKDTAACDSNLQVWMDDMANAFYKRGEHSIREDIKEYCLEHYLDIKLSTEDKLDPVLISRTMLLKSDCGQYGNYQKLVHYNEKLTSYMQRVNSVDPNNTVSMYLDLGMSYLLACRPADAEVALNRAFQPDQTNKSIVDDPRFYFYLGHAKEEEGDKERAKALYTKAFESIKKHAERFPSFNNTIYTGMYGATLGLLEYRLGNLTEADWLLRTSLITFEKCPVPKVNSTNKIIHPDGVVYSGQVFCLERLSQVASKQRKLTLARSLQEQAKKIRAQNSYWAATKNPDPDHFYTIAGFFPYPVDIIPTHVSLQEINSQ